MTVDGGEAVVIDVLEDTAGVLRAGDRIVEVDGQRVRRSWHAAAVIASSDDGTARLDVRRGGELLQLESSRRELSLELADAQLTVAIPVEVSLSPPWGGGNSSDLSYALGIYDALTPEPLAGGVTVAASACIAIDGSAQSVGSIRQKVAVAERSGVRVLLVAPANAAEARAAARSIQVIEVTSLAEAVTALEQLR